MKNLDFKITVLLFFIATSAFAQKVHYKDKYYTLVNNKIFHRGYNVYAELTSGQRDTIYMIARELYDDRGKLKEEYKKRRSRDRYKLPVGYWESKTNSTEQIATGNTNIKVFEETKEEDSLNTEKKSQLREKSEIKEKIEQHAQKEKKKKTEAENHQKRENDKEEKKQKRKESVVKEKERVQEKKEKQHQREERQEEKAQKKEEKEQKEKEREQRKTEKEQKKKEKELKAKEKAIKNHKDAKKKLKKAEDKYRKLKEKGELSPNDETEWLDKIEKLKEKVTKAEKKVD